MYWYVKMFMVLLFLAEKNPVKHLISRGILGLSI